jgi:hypothetical protein
MIKVIYMDTQDAGKILFAGAILVLVVTVLVAFGALFMVAFSGSLNTASPDATGYTIFAGTPGGDTQLNAPIISIGFFGKAAYINTVNTTPLVGANGVMTIPIDAYAAVSGAAWEGLNITINNTGANASTNWTWTVGTCNAVNKTIASALSQTWTDINSTCLQPGGWGAPVTLTLTFANKTTTGELAPNITGVGIKYFRYAANTAYSSNFPAGTVTPFLAGNYKTVYTYGSGGMDYTDAKTALSSGVTTISNIPSWLGLIVLVFVLIVIFIVLGAIAFVAKGMMGGNQ